MADNLQNINLSNLKSSSEEIEKLKSGTSAIQNNLSVINVELGTFNDLTSQLNEGLKKEVDAVKDIQKNYDKYYQLKLEIYRLEEKQIAGQNKINDLVSKLGPQGDTLKTILENSINARRDLGEYLTKSESAQAKLNAALSDGNVSQTTLNQLKQDAIDAADTLRGKEEESAKLVNILRGEYDQVDSSLLGIDDKLAKQIIQQAFLNEQTEDAVNNRERELKSIEDTIPPFQKLRSLIITIKEEYNEIIKNNQVFKSINDGISGFYDKIGLSFSKILDNVLALDKTLTEFGKSVQVSKEGARTLADNFQETSYEASEINKNVSSTQASIKNQIEANNNLNKSLGTGALFTKQTRLDQIELVKGMGLEAEVGAKIYGLGKLNRLTAHQTAVAIGDQVVNTRKSTGITLDYKKVLTDVAKISGQLAVQYKNNPILLAEAVTQAQLLGLTLEQTSKMGSSLVDDFAGSLGRELEAELLTGKALNLEQARYFALMNDSAKAAKELMNNVGGIEEFQQLNVLQQKSLAAAVGLTTDELSNALTQQEFLKGTAFETKAAFEEAAREAARTGDYTKLNAELAQAANGEELAAQASQISNQEKFQMAVEKLQETLANMVNGPFGKLIDGFANLVSNATVLKGIVGLISGIMGINLVRGIYDVGKGLVTLIAKEATLAKLNVFQVALLSGGAGLLAAGVAAAVGYAAINAIASDGGGDGGSNPSISGTGGINVPNSGANNDRNINITLKSENTVNLAGQKLSHLNTESQKQINTRRA